jgi:hypothetical protein
VVAGDTDEALPSVDATPVSFRRALSAVKPPSISRRPRGEIAMLRGRFALPSWRRRASPDSSPVSLSLIHQSQFVTVSRRQFRGFHKKLLHGLVPLFRNRHVPTPGMVRNRLSFAVNSGWVPTNGSGHSAVAAIEPRSRGSASTVVEYSRLLLHDTTSVP